MTDMKDTMREIAENLRQNGSKIFGFTHMGSRRVHHYKREKTGESLVMRIEAEDLNYASAAPVYLRLIDGVLFAVDGSGKVLGSQIGVCAEFSVDDAQTVTVKLAHQGFWEGE